MEIKTTSNYKQFKFIVQNRPINWAKVRHLADQIEMNNMLNVNPIIVNEDMEIFDGQHRAKAAEKLSVPLYYVVKKDAKLSDIITLNTTQSKWLMSDYLNYHENQALPEYAKLKQLITETGWSTSLALMWCSEGSILRQDFRIGKYHFFMSEGLAQAIVAANSVIDIIAKRQFQPISVQGQMSIHVAMRKFFLCGLVEIDRFMESFDKYFHMFKYCRDEISYSKQFLEIYNFHRKGKYLSITMNKNDYEYSSKGE